MNSNQDQGAVEKQTVEDVQAKGKQVAQTLRERAATVEERLAKATPSLDTEAKEEEAKASTQQPEPTPSSNQVETPKEEAKAEPKEEKTELPQDVKERTKERFNEVLEENKKLKEQLKKSGTGSVFDSLRPNIEPSVIPQMPQVPIQGQYQPPQVPDRRQFILPDGTVDIDGFNNALLAAEQRAFQSTQAARVAYQQALEAKQQVERYEESQQVKEARIKHPELDPDSDKFDAEFFNLVRDRVLSNRAQRVNQTLDEVASTIKNFYSPQTTTQDVEKAKEEAVEAYKSAQEARKQGPVESSQGQPRQEVTREENRERTRRGDPFALDERMRNLGILSKTST